MDARLGRVESDVVRIEHITLCRLQESVNDDRDNATISCKANTLEGRVLGTTPVGAYPAGATASGILDTSGNVYEWTHSQYRPYPYRVDDGREEETIGTNVRYTVRGGSWLSVQWSARVSSRISIYPGYFDYFNGFRMSVAPVFLP